MVTDIVEKWILNWQIAVIIAIGAISSIVLCSIVAFKIMSSKGIINPLHYHTLLTVTGVSAVSCLLSLIFMVDKPNSWAWHLFVSVIVGLIYLSQSAIPFVVIFDSIMLFDIRNRHNPIPSSDSIISMEQSSSINEDKKTQIGKWIYFIIVIISLSLIVLSNYAESNLVQYSLILIPFVFLECYFIIAGFKIHFSHFFDISFPVIPYALIRPIIFLFTAPVIIMNLSADSVAMYMSYAIIVISILAVCTMVLPLVLISNKNKRKRVYTFEHPLPSEVGTEMTHFQPLKSHSFTKDQIHQMKIIISALDEDEKINDERQQKQQLSPNNLHRSSTSLIRKMRTSTFKDLRAPTMYDQSYTGGAMSISTTPYFAKRKTESSNTKSNEKVSKTESAITTQESSTTAITESTKYSHFEEDTNEILAEGIQAQ